jgi:hypothetical protein
VVNGDSEETVRRFMAAIESDGDLDDLSEICVPSLAEEWRANMQSFAFTERTFTVDDVVVDGSKVAVLWTIAGPAHRLFCGHTANRQAHIEYRLRILYIARRKDRRARDALRRRSRIKATGCHDNVRGLTAPYAANGLLVRSHTCLRQPLNEQTT